MSAAGVAGSPASVSGARVVDRPQPAPGRRQRGGALGQAREPEVGQQRAQLAAAALEQDVGRLDVAVHEPGLVRGLQRVGDQRHDAGGDLRRQRAADPQLAAEVRPAHEPHRHVGQVVDDAGLVDRDHARVIERRGRARLAPEALAEAGIDGAVGGDHLQRHVPLQPEVHGVVHHAHPAAAQGRDDPVPGELRSRLEVDAHGQRYSYAGGVWRRTPPTRPRRRSCRPSSRRSAPTSRSSCTVTRTGGCGSSRSTPPRG